MDIRIVRPQEFSIIIPPEKPREKVIPKTENNSERKQRNRENSGRPIHSKTQEIIAHLSKLQVLEIGYFSEPDIQQARRVIYKIAEKRFKKFSSLEGTKYVVLSLKEHNKLVVIRVK